MEWKQHKAEEKRQAKERKVEEKERRKDEKALAKKRKEGEKESRRAEEEYAREHGMYPLTTRNRSVEANDATRPSGDTGVTAVSSENGHEGRKGKVSYEEDIGRPADVNGHYGANGTSEQGLSRPRRSRTTTSELEAGRLPSSPTLSEPNGDDVHNGNDGDPNDPEHLLELYAPPNKRPRHRTGFMGWFGQKVDTIEWCKVRSCSVHKSHMLMVHMHRKRMRSRV